MADYVEKFKKLGNLTQRALIALGVLSSNGSTDQFFTAADVTEKLITDSKIGHPTDEEFFELNQKVVLSLRQSEIGGKRKDLYASKKKVTPTICTRKNVKSSTGYRMGMPVTAAVTQDDVRSSNLARENPKQISISDIIKNTNDFNTLVAMASEVNERIKLLFQEYRDEHLGMADKLAKVKQLTKDL